VGRFRPAHGPTWQSGEGQVGTEQLVGAVRQRAAERDAGRTREHADTVGRRPTAFHGCAVQRPAATPGRQRRASEEGARGAGAAAARLGRRGTVPLRLPRLRRGRLRPRLHASTRRRAAAAGAAGLAAAALQGLRLRRQGVWGLCGVGGVCGVGGLLRFIHPPTVRPSVADTGGDVEVENTRGQAGV
jgi:hypothetical protein